MRFCISMIKEQTSRLNLVTFMPKDTGDTTDMKLFIFMSRADAKGIIQLSFMDASSQCKIKGETSITTGHFSLAFPVQRNKTPISRLELPTKF